MLAPASAPPPQTLRTSVGTPPGIHSTRRCYCSIAPMIMMYDVSTDYSPPAQKRSSTEALPPIRRSSAAAVLCRSGHLPKRRVAEACPRRTGPVRRPNNGNSLACVFAAFRVEAKRQPAMETKNATASQVVRCNVTTDTESNKAQQK